MTGTARRKLAAEFTGTALLAAVITGSGIAVTRLTGDAALRLLVNSAVTGLALTVLITVLGPASGAHFNPVVTAADWVLARRTGREYGAILACAVITCQVGGAIAGTGLADTMFAVPALAASRHHRASGPAFLSEIVATSGLLLVITALARNGQVRHTAWAVGAWISAGYWFTASTAFANPAITIGRTLTPTYAGIAPASAPAFIAAQIAGGLIGTVLAVTFYPVFSPPPSAGQAARLAS
jgi:arsenate reductase